MGTSVSSGAYVLGTRGEAARSSSVCARVGGGVELAGCLFLTDCPRDTSTCSRRSPATWRGGANHHTSFPARRVPGLEIPRGLTLPLSHVRASLFPGREGHDPKVGIRPPVLPRVPSTQVRESGLGRMNSQPESARSSVPPQSPRSPTARCPGPGWGAGGRHVPPGPGGWSPEEPRASPESGIGPSLPRSRPRRAERTVPADRADRRLQLSPCLRPRCPESLGPPLEKPGGCVPQRDQNTGLERSQF